MKLEHLRILPAIGWAMAVLVILGGCAHPLVISPDMAKIERDPGAKPIDKNVGYYIASDKREAAVNTPGGGGDTVTYHPYKDMEAGFYKMLSNVFKDVTVLKSPNDMDAIGQHGISYVITPIITTNSSSPSPFTWPPTLFDVVLTCNVTDAAGKSVVSKSVSGQGRAEFDEFKSDFSLSGKRAAQDALLKMQVQLLQAPELSN